MRTKKRNFEVLLAEAGYSKSSFAREFDLDKTTITKWGNNPTSWVIKVLENKIEADETKRKLNKTMWELKNLKENRTDRGAMYLSLAEKAIEMKTTRQNLHKKILEGKIKADLVEKKINKSYYFFFKI